MKGLTFGAVLSCIIADLYEIYSLKIYWKWNKKVNFTTYSTKIMQYA